MSAERCTLCENTQSPNYRMHITLSADGWKTIKADIDICSDCQYKILNAKRENGQ